MPSKTRLAARLLAAALLAGSLAACDSGMKIGSLQVIKPKQPLVATGVQLTRRHAEDLNQKLVVDLSNGRSVLTDTDGRAYPSQLSADSLETLRTIVASRAWQVGARRAAEGTADPVYYTLTVNNGDKVLKDQATWANPTRKPLPPEMAQLEEIFEQAQRTAHPLSEKVDLLK